MNPEYAKMMEEKLERVAAALEVIAEGFTVIVEEGITIYQHEDGPEAQN